MKGPSTNVPACVLENHPLIITKTSDKISINQNLPVSGSYPDLYVQKDVWTAKVSVSLFPVIRLFSRQCHIAYEDGWVG